MLGLLFAILLALAAGSLLTAIVLSAIRHPWAAWAWLVAFVSGVGWLVWYAMQSG